VEGAGAAGAERQRLRDAKRRKILPEIATLVADSLDGNVALGQHKDTFDRKTRSEWDLFGLKGMSGATLLNMLTLNLPNRATAPPLRASYRKCCAVRLRSSKRERSSCDSRRFSRARPTPGP
jgi:hypothetical protein